MLGQKSSNINILKQTSNFEMIKFRFQNMMLVPLNVVCIFSSIKTVLYAIKYTKKI